MTIKVGDELAFQCGYGSGYWRIHKVEKITPTGLIKCGGYTLDHDLRVRGQGRYSGPYRGKLVTQEIRDAVKRQHYFQKVSLMKPENLTTSQLERIVAIIAEEA
jgi:hypothetical protein